jgi:hypothetical protein
VDLSAASKHDFKRSGSIENGANQAFFDSVSCSLLTSFGLVYFFRMVAESHARPNRFIPGWTFVHLSGDSLAALSR